MNPLNAAKDNVEPTKASPRSGHCDLAWSSPALRPGTVFAGIASHFTSDWFLLSLFSRERSEPLHKALSRFFLFTRRSRKWPASADWPLRRKDWPPKVTGIYFPPAQQHHFPGCSSGHHFLGCTSQHHFRRRSLGASLPDEVGLASCRRQPCVPGCFSGHCDLA